MEQKLRTVFWNNNNNNNNNTDNKMCTGPKKHHTMQKYLRNSKPNEPKFDPVHFKFRKSQVSKY